MRSRAVGHGDVCRPCRGGWFQKCQDLAYVVLTQGHTSVYAQELALAFYAGPEARGGRARWLQPVVIHTPPHPLVQQWNKHNN